MTRETCFQKLLKFLICYFVSLPAFVLAFPIFKIYDLWNENEFGFTTLEKHKKKVAHVQQQIRDWNAKGRKNLMCTARKNWKTLSVHNIDKSKFNQISVDFGDIIELDTAKRILTVEPCMNMGNLTRILIPLGWTLPLIPELETLTVGGMINAGGIETASHKYGLFSEICQEYEVVMADGSVVICSKDQNVSLFNALPVSYGTIGFITAVKIPMIEARKYVKLEYIPANSTAKVLELLKTKDQDLLEGMMFDRTQGVVIFGNYVDEAVPSKVNVLNRWYMPWFYKHVQSFLNKPGGPHIEFIPLRNYYHRHTRSYWWEIEVIVPHGNHPLIRYPFGWIYPINFHLAKLFTPKYIWDLMIVKNHVVQDFGIRLNQMDEFMEFSHKLVKIYPIWLCPCMNFDTPGLWNSGHNETMLDIGIYGNTSYKSKFDPVETIRAFERFTQSLGGVQALYADTYLTRDEFEQMFVTSFYNQVRAEYKCDGAFPHIYDKVSCVARNLLSRTQGQDSKV